MAGVGQPVARTALTTLHSIVRDGSVDDLTNFVATQQLYPHCPDARGYSPVHYLALSRKDRVLTLVPLCALEFLKGSAKNLSRISLHFSRQCGDDNWEACAAAELLRSPELRNV